MPIVFKLCLKKQDIPANDFCLRGIGHPTGSGDHQIAKIGKLKNEHQLFGARTHKDIVRFGLNPEIPPVMFGHSLLQLSQTFNREVIFLKSILSESFNNGFWYGKGRLAQSEFENILSFPFEIIGKVINRHCCRGFESLDIGIEMLGWIVAFMFVHELSSSRV